MLPSVNRLRKKKEFSQVITTGKVFFSKYLILRHLVNKESGVPFRVGIIIRKKDFKTAVARNKIKRQIRHVFVNLNDQIKKQVDIVITIKKEVETLTIEEIEKQVLFALEKCSLINIQKK